MGWGFLQLPCLTWSLGNSSSVSSIICDKNSSMERRTVAVAPDERLRDNSEEE